MSHLCIKSISVKKYAHITFITLCTSLAIMLTSCSSETTVSSNKTKKETTTDQTTDISAQAADIFDFKTWKKLPVKQQKVSSSTLLSVVGFSSGESENFLDYHGNPAFLYKLRGESLEFFNLIDSTNLVEINWFKVVPSDSADMQVNGIENAKKAMLAAKSMLGNDGATLVEQIMTSEKGNATINLKPAVVRANCEAFFCRLVVSKNQTAHAKAP